ILNASTATEIDAAFPALVQRRAGALLVSSDPLFDSQRDRLVDLAARHSVPAIYQWREVTPIGGVISFATGIVRRYRPSRLYVAKILKGAKPADLPVLQPTKIELFINLV